MTRTPVGPLTTRAVCEALQELHAPWHASPDGVSFALFCPGTFATAQFVFAKHGSVSVTLPLPNPADEGYIVRGVRACHVTLILFELRVRRGGPFFGLTMASLLRSVRPPVPRAIMPATPATPSPSLPRPELLPQYMMSLDRLPAENIARCMPHARELALAMLPDARQSIGCRTCAAHLLWTLRDTWLPDGPDVRLCLAALRKLPMDAVETAFARVFIQQLVCRRLAREIATRFGSVQADPTP